MQFIDYWQAVQSRDASFDDEFVYAVTTTGIYCRPTCPARRPNRENVMFFKSSGDAEQAGYRPCKRCKPDNQPEPDPHTASVIQMCRYLEQAHASPPTLDDLGQLFHLSPAYLQRVFKRIVGVSPRQYADTCRQNRLRDLLQDDTTVTDALYEAGYTSSSQVYEITDNLFGMAPTHYRQGAPNTTIRYAIVPYEIGYLLAATTERGLCKIALGDDVNTLEQDLQTEFSQADVKRDDTYLADTTEAISAFIAGEQIAFNLPLDIRATAFQRRVWEALRQIPYGETRSYKELAEMVGQPKAARAVAGACAKNPVALVIPCHRIVRTNGDSGGYRWGLERKETLLATERARANKSS